MLPSGPYEGIPRGRSQNLPSSVLGPISVPGQGGLMSAAPGSSVMGPGPPGAPVVTSTLTSASGTGQILANSLKNGTLSGMEEEVRTLFVSGLPMDVRLRELYLLFRCYEGYEGSFLKLISSKPGKPPQPIAFVSFKLRKQAEKALSELQGVRFDPASSQTLRLEFARTNSRVSPKQQQQPQQQPVQPQQHAQQQQPHHQQSYHHHLPQQPQSLQQPQQQQVGAGQHHHHHQQHHLNQHQQHHLNQQQQQQQHLNQHQQQQQQQQQQQLSPHALHNAHSPHQQHMAAMALGQNSASQGYVNTYSGPSKSNSSLGYYFLPATLHAHQNAMAQGLYNMQDWSRMQMSYNAISHVSTPSPTLSPAPSTPHLSVLNILSDTDSSAAPSPTPDHSAAALPGSLSSSSSSLASGNNSISIAPQVSASDVVPSSVSPTSTLVVANIDQSYSEEDVRNIFKDSQGYIQTKLQYSGGQMFGVVDFKDAECASEALERFQDMTLSSSSSNRNTGLIVYFAQAFNAEVSWHHKYGNSENLDDGSLGTPSGGGIVPPTTSTVASTIPPIGNPSLGAIGTSTGIAPGNSAVGSGNPAIGSGSGASANANSMSIPQQVSIPIHYQNGHIDTGSLSAIDLNQQMSELDLNMQPCPSPVLSVGNPGSSPSSGLPPQQGYVEYPPHMGGASGGFGGQNYPSHQLLYSDSYPQGAVFLNNYSSPMMASWQFNPNINQGIK